MKSKNIILLLALLGIGTINFNGSASPLHAALTQPAKTYEGKEQSPINLTGAYELDIVEIKFNYIPSPGIITNTGHSTEISLVNENSITVDGSVYKLVQFHFHTPSEHYIEGTQFPMEIHFVHQNSAGNLAVIGVVVIAGPKNNDFETILQNIPKDAHGSTVVSKAMNLMTLFPSDPRIYRYNGSLTTPPFTEGVKWLVMKTPVQLSTDQINRIQVIMGKNNRPLQNRNNRPIVLDTSAQ